MRGRSASKNFRYRHAYDIRADLQRLRRDTNSGSSVAINAFSEVASASAMGYSPRRSPISGAPSVPPSFFSQSLLCINQPSCFPTTLAPNLHPHGLVSHLYGSLFAHFITHAADEGQSWSLFRVHDDRGELFRARDRQRASKLSLFQSLSKRSSSPLCGPTRRSFTNGVD